MQNNSITDCCSTCLSHNRSKFQMLYQKSRCACGEIYVQLILQELLPLHLEFLHTLACLLNSSLLHGFLTSKFIELWSPARQQIWPWIRSKVTVKVTTWYHPKGLVTKNTHAKYQSSTFNSAKVMAKVKVFVTDRQTDEWDLMSPHFRERGGQKWNLAGVLGSLHFCRCWNRHLCACQLLWRVGRAWVATLHVNCSGGGHFFTL